MEPPPPDRAAWLIRLEWIALALLLTGLAFALRSLPLRASL